MRERRYLQIGENVYWISAAATARGVHNGGKGANVWSRVPLPQCVRLALRAAQFTRTKAVALDVAVELEEFIQGRFLQASGLALAGGVLSASLLSLM